VVVAVVNVSTAFAATPTSGWTLSDAWHLVRVTLPAMLVMYPFGIVLLCHFLFLETRRINDAAALDKAHARLKARWDQLQKANIALTNEVAERILAEDRLRKLTVAVEQSPTSVLITDQTGIIEYVNPAYTALTGWSSEESVGRMASVFESGLTTPREFYRMWHTVRSGGTWRAEIRNHRRDAEPFWERVAISPVRDTSDQTTHFLIVAEDVTLRKEFEEHLLRQATTDSVTGLPNRIFAMDRLKKIVARSPSNTQKMALLLIDLDNFKNINDTLGHHAGDRMLAEAGQRISSCVDSDEMVAHMGGDEFTVLLSGIADADEATRTADTILASLRAPYELESISVFVTASIGITVYPDHGEKPEVLLRNADAAVFQAKEAGRDRRELFSASQTRGTLERVVLETKLRRAVDEDLLRIHYQPIVNINTGEVEAVESLLRWTDPELGKIEPERFIPVAEEIGVIITIGRRVLSDACERIRRWRDLGADDLRISVNISSRQLQDDLLIDNVVDSLEKNGLPPDALELEITENVVIGEHPVTRNHLRRLSEIGVGLTLDDFGTGYSSLSYLRLFPFGCLKIDKSFVGDLLMGTEDTSLVEAVITLAQSLGLRVVAEGVDRPEIVEFLLDRGCGLLQGFLFSRAVPASEIDSILVDSGWVDRQRTNHGDLSARRISSGQD
jgi:diguanylate cyclase (GGDEF)-like protein/PAS domain S-box-containing protein